MARIIEEIVLVRLSKIVKSTDTGTEKLVTKEVLDAIEMMADNTVGDGIVVEVAVEEP